MSASCFQVREKKNAWSNGESARSLLHIMSSDQKWYVQYFWCSSKMFFFICSGLTTITGNQFFFINVSLDNLSTLSLYSNYKALSVSTGRDR